MKNKKGAFLFETQCIYMAMCHMQSSGRTCTVFTYQLANEWTLCGRTMNGRTNERMDEGENGKWNGLTYRKKSYLLLTCKQEAVQEMKRKVAGLRRGPCRSLLSNLSRCDLQDLKTRSIPIRAELWIGGRPVNRLTGGTEGWTDGRSDG